MSDTKIDLQGSIVFWTQQHRGTLRAVLTAYTKPPQAQTRSYHNTGRGAGHLIPPQTTELRKEMVQFLTNDHSPVGDHMSKIICTADICHEKCLRSRHKTGLVRKMCRQIEKNKVIKMKIKLLLSSTLGNIFREQITKNRNVNSTVKSDYHIYYLIICRAQQKGLFYKYENLITNPQNLHKSQYITLVSLIQELL